MSDETRRYAEAIAPVVRRECREVGLMMVGPSGAACDAWRLAWSYRQSDGARAYCWIDAEGTTEWDGDPGWAPEPVDHLAFASLMMTRDTNGIPDLSDGACLDALIRWLRAAGVEVRWEDDALWLVVAYPDADLIDGGSTYTHTAADAIHAACRALWPEEVGDA